MKLHLDFLDATIKRRKNWLFALDLHCTMNFHASKSYMNFTRKTHRFMIFPPIQMTSTCFCLATIVNRKPYIKMPLLMQQLDVGLISTLIGWRLSPTLPHIRALNGAPNQIWLRSPVASQRVCLLPLSLCRHMYLDLCILSSIT
jgi:hypothetical protein